MTTRLVRPAPRSALARWWKNTRTQLRFLGYGTRFYRHRLKGQHPLRLEGSPDDPLLGFARRGADILNGTFRHAGHEISLSDGHFWTQVDQAPGVFRTWAMSFDWLRDLNAMGDEKRARALAEKLMAEWLAHYSLWHEKAWRPDLIGGRLINWSLHAPLVLSTNDMVYRSLVLNCMAYQARHLVHVALKGENGPRRIRTLVGLAVAGHTMPNGTQWAKRGLTQLEAQLKKLVLADGGMATRNPHDLVHVARDLITLRAVMEWFSCEVPEWIQITFDRIVPFVKAMTHGDHRLSHFNGSYEGREEDLDEILNLSRAKGRAISMAPHTGYQRLKRQRTLLLVDVGVPPRNEMSATCHLAPLAFELSDGKDRVIVNSGGTVRGHANDIRAAYPNRHTAAHSTLIINGSDAGSIDGRGAVAEGAGAVVFERNENDDGLWLDGWHNAYVARYGLSHQRRLFLSNDGGDLRGEDLLIPEKAGFFGALRGKTPKPVEVRFHLHPMCNASPTMNGAGIIIRTPMGHGWLFRSKGADIALEDDVYRQRPGEEQRTKMIVLKTVADNKGLKLNWSFKRMDT